MSAIKWEVGQTVDVQSRTWAGINKPGGCAKITKVRYAKDGHHVESIDVKYVLGGGCEKDIDPAIVSPYETLEREGRKRRGRDFLMDRAEDVVKKVKQAMSKKKTAAAAGNGKQSSGAAAANRTPAQPDHSTSPSTPVTPEHPSAINTSKPSKPLSSTTVPSFVIADSTSVEVSPLQDPINRTNDVSTKTSTIARRGLFGVSKKTQEKPKPVNENQKNARVTHAAEDMSSSASSQLAPQTSQEVQRAHSAAIKLSLSKKQNKFMTQNVPSTGHKEVAVANSSQRTSSLKNVFDQELRKAREFLDEVCRAPHKDIKEELEDPTSKESRLDTSGSEADETDKKPAASISRREEFLNLFRSFRQSFDDEDGAMEEKAFRTLISQKAVKPFSPAELDENLEYLYQEAKLMKSDGILYVID